MAEDWQTRAKERGFSVGAMALTTELEDGSRVEVTDSEIVPMGDVFAYRQLTHIHDSDGERPASRIVFETRGGVPVCVSLHLEPIGPVNHIRAKDLNGIKLDNLRDDVYAAAGVFALNPGGGFVRKLGHFHRDRKHVEHAAQRRRVTPDFLGRVADVYNATPAGGRLEAVQAAFGVSERTALRYTKQIKEKGMVHG